MRFSPLASILTLAVGALLSAAPALAQLGPDHPPIDGNAPRGGGGMPMPERSSARLAADLPTGTVEIEARGPQGEAVPGAPATLQILQRSPAIGEKRSERRAVTDANGRARFADLSTSSDHQYTAVVDHASATYTAPAVQLDPDRGARAVVRVFPSSRRIEEVQIGSMCFVGVSQKDDFLQVEVAMQILNLGRVTWLPSGYRIELPAGHRAFVVSEEDNPVHFVEVPGGAELNGSITPGEHQASFRFQVKNPAQSFFPWEQRDAVELALGMPPGVLRASAWSDFAPGMRLSVGGFSAPTQNRMQDGTPGWVATFTAKSGSDQLARMPIRLDGVPRKGSVPFFTVASSLALVAWGATEVFRRRKPGLAEGDVNKARERLLDELVAVERALESGTIGPKTHEKARRTLLEALARLEFVPGAGTELTA